MTVIVDPCEASPETLAQLADLISERAPTSSEVGESYDIDYVQKSESAWILFAHKEGREGERYVIKLLCSYNDRRYDLESLARRQDCQLEALTRNSIFSPAIYVGLASSYRLLPEQKRITLGIPTYDTTQLNPQTEYALVMHQLSSESRLDFLLEHADKNMLKQLMHHLIRRIVKVHNDSPALPLNEAQNWGGFPKLQEKLEHNLSLADPLFEKKHYNALYQRLQPRFANLKVNLQQIFDLYPYATYFEQRVRQEYIKHCHGDLKGPNIWVEQGDTTEEGYEGYVAILDAIDFNPMYSNIDTLSDFATLVIDIQTRLHCTKYAHRLAQRMIVWYLTATGQDHDDTARAVLHYYLVEKAFVGAAISIIYDNLPKLGIYFLQVAETCWEEYFAERLAALKAATPKSEPTKALTLSC
ncbi:MAG: hypothetical protein NVS2B12_04380 [Ktedonobacteraceae bacterium]